MAYNGLTPDDMTQMMRAMASMARVWNAFNQLGHQETHGSSSGFGFPHDQWSGSSPWVSDWPGRWGMPGTSGFPGRVMPWGERRRDSRRVSPAAHRLDGTWQGRNGEIVTIQGNRFRIRNPSGQKLDGTFMTYGNRLIALCAQNDYTCRFNFEMRGELLALQNEAGDILLFRRLNRGRRW